MAPERREGAQIPRSSVAREHSDRSSPVQNVDHDMPVGAPEGDVGRSAANLQTAQYDLIEELRKNGLPKFDLSRAGVQGQADAGLDEIEGGGGRPCLRDASDRVKCWPSRLLTRKAAIQLRQTPQVDIVVGVKEAFKDSRSLAL